MGLAQQLRQGCVLARLWEERTCPSRTGQAPITLHNGHPLGRALPLTLKYCRAARCEYLLLFPLQKHVADGTQAAGLAGDEQRGLPDSPPLPAPRDIHGYGRNAQQLRSPFPSPSPPALPYNTSSFPRLPALDRAGLECAELLGHGDLHWYSHWYPPAATAQPVPPRLCCWAGPSHPTIRTPSP